MASCELCGKKAELYRTLVEDTELLVCKECSTFGKVLKKVEIGGIKKVKKPVKQEEAIEMVIDNFSSVIKNTREGLGLTQKDFAFKIREKESLIQKMESGHLKPSITLARKLEKMLNLKLIEEISEQAEIKNLGKGKSTGVTIGDLIKTKN